MGEVIAKRLLSSPDEMSKTNRVDDRATQLVMPAEAKMLLSRALQLSKISMILVRNFLDRQDEMKRVPRWGTPQQCQELVGQAMDLTV